MSKLFSPKQRNWYFGIAAGVIVVGIILPGILLINIGNKADQRRAEIIELYSINFQAYKHSGTLKGKDSLFNVGLAAYNEKAYSLAEEAFTLYLEDSADLGTYFYRGLALMESGNYDAAHQDLLKVIEGQASVWIPHAEWYAVLGMIKAEDVDGAAKNLKIMEVTGGYPYKEKAVQLLDDLSPFLERD
ncbi:MAG: tetratricopeptide (TPR) repeat protein [Limisphaerales bacterium]|jgi:tetratricopeptide (TPR) repeat protein